MPVLRNAEALGLAPIEHAIRDFGERARNGALQMEELTGGTFTITNGGIFGSLMSTPILNPPQSGILGMHKIQQRPMVVDGKIEARPMMYLALDVRSPHRRRARSRTVPRAREGPHRGSGASPARDLTTDSGPDNER